MAINKEKKSPRWATEKRPVKQSIDSMPSSFSLSFDHKKTTVFMNYKEPTPLSLILSEISGPLNVSVIMEPKYDRPIQIFSQKKLTEKDAFHLLLATLETVGLRVISMGERIIKITPHRISHQKV